MKKIVILTATIMMIFLSGCTNKPSKIEKISPCAYCDFSK